MVQMKRASELLLGVPVEGEQVKLEEIADQDVIVTAFGFFDSDLGPSAAVIVRIDDDDCWFVTASQILVEGLGKLAEEVPFLAKFVSHVSATDRQYWTME